MQHAGHLRNQQNPLQKKLQLLLEGIITNQTAKTEENCSEGLNLIYICTSA